MYMCAYKGKCHNVDGFVIKLWSVSKTPRIHTVSAYLWNISHLASSAVNVRKSLCHETS